LRSTLAPLAPLAIAALIAVSAAAGEARANPRAPEVVKALEALRTRRFEDAIKACAPRPSGEIQPSCPFIRAHALHALGKHLEAYEALRMFGVHGGEEAKNAPVAREALRSVLLTHLARVTVACSVEGPAEVVVNGKVAKTCPTTGPIVTEPGEIDIEVRKAGFKTAQATVQASAGGSVTARIDLVPSSESTPAAQNAPKQSDPKKPETATGTATEPATEPSPENKTESKTASKPIKPWPIPPRSASRSKSSTASSTKSKSSASSPSPSEIPPSDPAPASDSSCGPTCVLILVVGGIGLVGLGAAIFIGVTEENVPAPTGDIPPGQVRLPLVAW
jgi:hypothetical protein